QIVGQELKVMRRIEPRECAIEGVITRHGTLVGPLMAELTGFPELTPYDGGWCGNDVSPDVLTERQRTLARQRTAAMGERPRRGRGDRLLATGHRLAYRARRERGVLPADRGGRAVPLSRRGPRHPGDPGPLHGRRARAARPRAHVDLGDQVRVPERGPRGRP